jgi:hypothetical protein
LREKGKEIENYISTKPEIVKTRLKEIYKLESFQEIIIKIFGKCCGK